LIQGTTSKSILGSADMNSKSRTIRTLTSTGFVVVALAGLFLAVRGSSEVSAAKPAGKAAPGASASASPVIQVSFKLDPRLTRSLYMGDRWVSPPNYQHATQVGDSSTLEARAEVIDTKGRPLAARPTWTPADPEMVSVSPSQGNQVHINVRRAGQSRLKLAYGGASKELTVKAVHEAGAWRVDVAQ
jgi:hypothetical protein